ncbi:cyclophilin-like fold protein [Prauserella alba]|uniref:Cyclophilin-like domain-containing protein n=1 Tax=Prauserella alba TaxID=176898 RepID=A0ABN1VEQ4_9PSEU|nr:cyclophilin-like fold protein [Prauserella alba]MCP2179095.1 Cyclophilin-like [Prauserella alba]
MDIRITTGTATLTGTLNDSTAARDLAAMLPLTVALADFHDTEKIADLPRTLRTAGSPSGAAATIGDIADYAPWGNLAIFYRDFPHAAGLVVLGHIDDPLDALPGTESDQAVTIAAVA